MIYFGIWLMRAIAPLPLPWLRALGGLLGRILFVLARHRRHIVLTNLRLCFPQWTAQQLEQVARKNFVVFCQAFLDRAWLWHGPKELAKKRIYVHGALDDVRNAASLVLFAPHFYGLDAGGSGLQIVFERDSSTIFMRSSSPVVDDWLTKGRQRFGHMLIQDRSAGLKPIVQSLRKGRALYLLPDMDFGAKDSIFVPFFGVAAATVASLSRFARLGRAVVVPLVTRLTPTGYDVTVYPAWKNFPTDDVVSDTRRMNECLEAYIREIPEQYYWVHKRFKTRPSGEPPLY